MGAWRLCILEGAGGPQRVASPAARLAEGRWSAAAFPAAVVLGPSEPGSAAICTLSLPSSSSHLQVFAVEFIRVLIPGAGIVA